MKRKGLMVLILGLLLAGSSFAEIVDYQVKYVDEYGITKSATYTVITTSDKDISNWDVPGVRRSYDVNEIIDEDSDPDDIAIVNKLDKHGYIHAYRNGDNIKYLKIDNQWHMFYGYHECDDGPVTLNE